MDVTTVLDNPLYSSERLTATCLIVSWWGIWTKTASQ